MAKLERAFGSQSKANGPGIVILNGKRLDVGDDFDAVRFAKKLAERRAKSPAGKAGRIQRAESAMRRRGISV